MAFPFNLKQVRRNPDFYDIREDLPNFETIEDATNESQIRQKALIKGGFRDLAGKLADCAEDYRCESPACPQCVRHNRRGFYHAAAVLSEQYDLANQRTVTLICYSEAMTNEELESFDPNRLTARLSKQLTRCGFENPVIGGLELDYHEDIDLWIPHFHLLVVDDISPLVTLRKKHFKKEKRPTSDNPPTSYISRSMMVQELKHPPEQLSYLCKQRWQLIRPYEDPETGKRKTRKLRLKGYKFILSLAVLDRYTFSDLMLLYRVRIVNNEFRVTPSVCE